MNINECLEKFKAVSLSDIKSVSLMDRVDVKFVFRRLKLSQLLEELANFYNVLEVDGVKIQSYKSLYYDTIDKGFFIAHHNNRVNRNKVRFREYVGSGLVFLEVKLKNNKGKTIKNRIKVDTIPDSLSNEHQNYIRKIIGKDLVLTSQQWVNFDRITFVDKMNTERLTIDLNLTFSNQINSGSFEQIIVAEIKKERSGNSSKFARLAKKMHILPVRLSKYCMSMIYLDPNIKQNRCKEKLLLINKLKQV